jgi:hypothetical protein
MPIKNASREGILELTRELFYGMEHRHAAGYANLERAGTMHRGVARLTRDGDDAPTCAEITDLVLTAFRFLEDVEGCTPELEQGAGQSVVAFVGDPTTYEVEIDCREGAVFLLVCRSIDGRRPPGYYMHDGRRTRAHLAEVLDTGGELEKVGAAGLRKALHASGSAAMKAQIRMFAAALREVLELRRDIVSDYFNDD